MRVFGVPYQLVEDRLGKDWHGRAVYQLDDEKSHPGYPPRITNQGQVWSVGLYEGQTLEELLVRWWSGLLQADLRHPEQRQLQMDCFEALRAVGWRACQVGGQPYWQCGKAWCPDLTRFARDGWPIVDPSMSSEFARLPLLFCCGPDSYLARHPSLSLTNTFSMARDATTVEGAFWAYWEDQAVARLDYLSMYASDMATILAQHRVVQRDCTKIRNFLDRTVKSGGI